MVINADRVSHVRGHKRQYNNDDTCVIIATALNELLPKGKTQSPALSPPPPTTAEPSKRGYKTILGWGTTLTCCRGEKKKKKR